jgi:hypothetical protein
MTSSNLEFVDSLRGYLDIELYRPAQSVAPRLVNLLAPPRAKILSLRLTPQVDDPANEEWRDMTPDELESIAFRRFELRLRSQCGRIFSFEAPNYKYFTTRELYNAIEQVERLTRDDSACQGGVDADDVFFEGIHEASDGVWDIWWGS